MRRVLKKVVVVIITVIIGLCVVLFPILAALFSDFVFGLIDRIIGA